MPPLRTLLSIPAVTRGAVALTLYQAIRIALALPPAHRGRFHVNTDAIADPGLEPRPARGRVLPSQSVERADPERRSRFPTPVRVISAYNGTMSGAPSRAASAVRSSGWRCDS